MRIAAIDIGTNTILMLVAEARNGFISQVYHDAHAIVRLGKGVDSAGFLLPETIQRVSKTLGEYVLRAREAGAECIVACGTSALRDARNREEFVRHVEGLHGIRTEILSGDEEALLTYRGAVSGFADPNVVEACTVLDIGGGSTEIVRGANGRIQELASLQIGSVRLTERFLKDSPPSAEQIRQVRDVVRSALAAAPAIPPNALIVGVAGTLTTLAAIDLALPTYDRNRVEGHVMPTTRIEAIFRRLSVLSLTEMAAIPQILPERADILVAGILVLLEILNHYRAGSVVASDRGLRYGLVARESERV